MISFMRYVGLSRLFDFVTSLTRLQNEFRRIGRTEFLLYSLEPTHRSHSLSTQDDAESNLIHRQPTEELASTSDPIHALMILQDEQIRHRRKYPLHHAACDPQVTPSQLDVLIEELFKSNPDSIRSRDENGYTPLHVAAHCASIPAIRALLALPSPGPRNDLAKRDNVDGTNVLETCQRKMRTERETEEKHDGHWHGYPEAFLRTEYMLKLAVGEDVGGLDEDAYTGTRKFGCTCNQCYNGKLSPRMRTRLVGKFT